MGEPYIPPREGIIANPCGMSISWCLGDADERNAITAAAVVEVTISKGQPHFRVVATKAWPSGQADAQALRGFAAEYGIGWPEQVEEVSDG